MSAGWYRNCVPKQGPVINHLPKRSMSMIPMRYVSVAEAGDPNVKDATRSVAYRYTGLTMVPLIIFNF
jgi:hypothetical protein